MAGSILLRNARIVDPSADIDQPGSLLIEQDKIRGLGAPQEQGPDDCVIFECRGAVVAPGLIDMRVFTGEPGAEHRETLASAGKAAAAGGVTTFVMMPDTEPVIDDVALVDFIARRGRDTSEVTILPSASLTKGQRGREMTEIGLLGEAGAVLFTDGRRPVSDAGLMRRIMTYGRDFGALIAHLPLEPSLVANGVMNEGEAASRLGLAGIPREAEIIMLERDLRLAALTESRYHAAQISCASSVEAIARAKGAGVDATGAVSIAHLSLNEYDIGPYRTFFKLAPPLRSEDDRCALVAGLKDGTIDVVVSAHDPQAADTKRHPFAEAADGAIGLETLLAAGLRLVHSEDVPLMVLLRALSTRPAQLLGLEGGKLSPGAPADLVIFDPELPWVAQESSFHSKSKNSAFEGVSFQGRVLATLVGGKTIYRYRADER